MFLVEARNLPAHVGIIMDGNGRWAQLRGQPRVAGHKEGAAAVRRDRPRRAPPRAAGAHALRLQRAELGAPRGRGRRAHAAAPRVPPHRARRDPRQRHPPQRHRQPRAPARRSSAPCSTRSAATSEANATDDAHARRSRTAAARRSPPPRASSPRRSPPGRIDPDDVTAERAPRAHAEPRRRRSGPRHPHGRRAAHLELPPLRPRLRRAPLRRRALARLRRRTISSRPSRATRRASGASAASGSRRAAEPPPSPQPHRLRSRARSPGRQRRSRASRSRSAMAHALEPRAAPRDGGGRRPAHPRCSLYRGPPWAFYLLVVRGRARRRVGALRDDPPGRSRRARASASSLGRGRVGRRLLSARHDARVAADRARRVPLLGPLVTLVAPRRHRDRGAPRVRHRLRAALRRACR